MPRTTVKICGLTLTSSIAAALRGGASHLGFIFFPASPRHVTPQRAAELLGGVRGEAIAVAVTVNAGDDLLDEIVSVMSPGLLQLHGDETAERVRELKRRYGLPVMKALSVRQTGDLDAIGDFFEVADQLLLDARPPADAVLPGGNGAAFDWSMLDGVDPVVDYMLSGGITVDNVARALRYARAGGIDVSSGVESSPGVKDDALINRFLARVGRFETAAAE
jgi:phosphoribosylanthranilate isomerase